MPTSSRLCRSFADAHVTRSFCLLTSHACCKEHNTAANVIIPRMQPTAICPEFHKSNMHNQLTSRLQSSHTLYCRMHNQRHDARLAQRIHLAQYSREAQQTWLAEDGGPHYGKKRGNTMHKKMRPSRTVSRTQGIEQSENEQATRLRLRPLVRFSVAIRAASSHDAAILGIPHLCVWNPLPGIIVNLGPRSRKPSHQVHTVGAHAHTHTHTQA